VQRGDGRGMYVVFAGRRELESARWGSPMLQEFYGTEMVSLRREE